MELDRLAGAFETAAKEIEELSTKIEGEMSPEDMLALVPEIPKIFAGFSKIAPVTHEKVHLSVEKAGSKMKEKIQAAMAHFSKAVKEAEEKAGSLVGLFSIPSLKEAEGILEQVKKELGVSATTTKRAEDREEKGEG